MPAVVNYVASKYLAQKWETERFRIHKMKVNNAFSLIDKSPPKQHPHLKLGVNKIAMEEERLARYENENQMLMNKIRVIVNGRGMIDNWNTWSRKDLHAAARLKQQREIERSNQAMLRRLRDTKPVIQKQKQEEAYQRHKNHKDMMAKSIKDYKSPRLSLAKSGAHEEDEDDGQISPGKQTEAEKQKKPLTSESVEEEEEDAEVVRDKEDTQDDGKGNTTSLPPIPPAHKSKPKKSKPPPENSRKNRRADVPKLPAIN